MKIFDIISENYRNRDAYQRDYDSSRTGFGKRGREDDEYVNGDDDHTIGQHQHQDVAHDVHIDGRKWKTFGSHSHASNVARKLQSNGKKATVHKSLEETATAGATSAANVAIGPVYKNKPAKAAKNKDGTVKNAQDMDTNLLTGGSIKR